jgi:hypothetical protein
MVVGIAGTTAGIALAGCGSSTTPPTKPETTNGTPTATNPTSDPTTPATNSASPIAPGPSDTTMMPVPGRVAPGQALSRIEKNGLWLWS